MGRAPCPWDSDVAHPVCTQVLVLVTLACVSAAFAASLAATNPSMKGAALRAASAKGGGNLRRPPPFVEAARSAATFMDRCVAAVQVEEFGLPKSGVSTARQRSKMFRI